MKLSTRLGIIVGCAAIGTLLLMHFGLRSVYLAMQSDRQDEIRIVTTLAQKQVAVYLAQEKAGKLSREEAQAKAKEALSGLRSGDDYVFVRTMDGMVLVHPDSRKEGKVDMGSKLPDGRTLMQTYVDAVQATDLALVTVNTKRPGGDVEVPKINGLAKVPEWGWIIGFGMFSDEIEKGFWQNAAYFASIGFAILAALVTVTVVMTRRIYRALGGEPEFAAATARAIADGDLRQTISRTGAPGSLMESMKHMQTSLSALIDHVQKNADRVGQASKDLSLQMEQINAASAQSSDAISSTASAIEEMAVSVDHISHSAKDTEVNASRAVKLANEGEGLVQDASKEIGRAAVQVEDATALIGGLVERSREIGGIASVIKEIADQTNLLALNAAIEAARAGEQGRGFAVVADEVRKLAERTSQATGQISGMIQAINVDTTSVVTSMQLVGPQVAAGVDKAEKAGGALREIHEASGVALSNVTDVAAATKEQSQASASVARNVEQISNMVEESAQSVRAANENVVALERLAGELHQSVARFRV